MSHNKQPRPPMNRRRTMQHCACDEIHEPWRHCILNVPQDLPLPEQIQPCQVLEGPFSPLCYTCRYRFQRPVHPESMASIHPKDWHLPWNLFFTHNLFKGYYEARRFVHPSKQQEVSRIVIDVPFKSFLAFFMYPTRPSGHA